MKRTLAVAIGSALLLSGAGVHTQPSVQRPPIIDMHMHAMPADYYGKPPAKMCAQQIFPVGVGNRRVIDSFDTSKCEALAARFVKNGTWQCPTLHNTWRHAHADDPLLTGDARARYFPPAVRSYWARKSRNDVQLVAFPADWQMKFEREFEAQVPVKRDTRDGSPDHVAAGGAHPENRPRTIGESFEVQHHSSSAMSGR
jgi:hypothetical protein